MYKPSRMLTLIKITKIKLLRISSKLPHQRYRISALENSNSLTSQATQTEDPSGHTVNTPRDSTTNASKNLTHPTIVLGVLIHDVQSDNIRHCPIVEMRDPNGARHIMNLNRLGSPTVRHVSNLI